MTLETARKEAARRTAVMGTVHYVFEMSQGYIVTARPVLGHEPINTYVVHNAPIIKPYEVR